MEEPVEAQQVEEPKPVDHNWEQARQLMQMQKARIEELERRHAPTVEKDELEDMDPEDYVTVAKANKLAEKKAREVAMQAVQQYSREQNITSDEARMRKEEQDYDYVIENFAAQLFRDQPALAYHVQQSRNPAETAYLLAKTSSNYKAYMAKQNGTSKADKIKQNASRPATGSALGPTKVTSDPTGGKSKDEIWKEAQEYARKA